MLHLHKKQTSMI